MNVSRHQSNAVGLRTGYKVRRPAQLYGLNPQAAAAANEFAGEKRRTLSAAAKRPGQGQLKCDVTRLNGVPLHSPDCWNDKLVQPRQQTQRIAWQAEDVSIPGGGCVELRFARLHGYSVETNLRADRRYRLGNKVVFSDGDASREDNHVVLGDGSF